MVKAQAGQNIDFVHMNCKGGKGEDEMGDSHDKSSFLEMLFDQMNCEYLSDLRFLSRLQRQKLARMVECVPAEDVALCEWNDALFYLLDASPEQSSAAAKRRLLESLLT